MASSPSIRGTILETLAITPSLSGNMSELKAACGIQCSNTELKRALGSLAYNRLHQIHGVMWRRVYDPVLDEHAYLVTIR